MSTTRKLKKAAKKAGPADPVLRVEQDLLARKNTDGSLAIMRLDNDESFFILDGIAAEFWAMIDGNSPISTLKQQLVRKHQPPVVEFDRDVARLVTELKKERLVRIS
jgi:hypothetical protein